LLEAFSFMLYPQAVAALTSQFQDMLDGQTLKSLELIRMLLECSPDPFSREQFAPGHITCSGLVLTPDARLLIVHHRRLGRWLLPGGHVELSDATIDATATREVLEETGISVANGRLAGADVHGIPAKGREPYHLHHDLLFRFRAEAEALVCSPESRAVAWCAPDEFDRYAIPDNVRRAWDRYR
jgi:8-oxo-dGTP pyrophosphatase MutT (NUDIX family)